MEKILELAKKLKELSDRGVEGERVNADIMLKRLMTKHGITLDMITQSDVIEYTFRISDEQHRMWRQIVLSVIGRSAEIYYKKKDTSKKKYYWLKCTPSEYIEINAKLNFYLTAYKKEEDLFYSAFIQKNKLYVKPDEKTDELSNKPMTQEEKTRLYKIVNMMEGMDRHVFVKQLENK